MAAHLDAVREAHAGYHCRPVGPFGDTEARFLIVGLAPGKHGANRTGRPFTGDHAGILLYRMLFDYGFSSRPESVAADDGLRLLNCRITNAVKCLPPDNKPVGAEISTCNAYLANEIRGMPGGSVILALGGIAHRAAVRALSRRQADFPFGHAAEHEISPGTILLDSYHCSRYNTNTGRLSEEMFRSVFDRAKELLVQANR